MTFMDRLRALWARGAYIAVSLDPVLEKLPDTLSEFSTDDALFAFNKAIIDETADLVGAYKPNSAFYEAEGEAGIRALKRTISYIADSYPDVPVILDAKRGDIGNTSEAYAKSAFDELGADAITIHPYLGREAAEPYLSRSDYGVFVLARTSNPGAKEFQDLMVDGEPLYMRVARNVSADWNTNGNCGLVVGATYVEEISNVRRVAPELPLLIPGAGAQGGDARAAFTRAKNREGGVLIVLGRSVIYASKNEDFPQAARAEVEKVQKELLE